MSAPTVKQLQRWTREPCFAVDQKWINDAFSSDRAGIALERWQRSRVAVDSGLWMGGRRGFVLFWEFCRARLSSGLFDPALYAALTAEVWVEGKQDHACREFQICEPGELVETLEPFALSSVIMSDADLDAYAALPDRVTLYRGGSGPAATLERGHSWSVAPDHALWFRDNRPDGLLIEREADKSDMIAFFVAREAEAVFAEGVAPSPHPVRTCGPVRTANCEPDNQARAGFQGSRRRVRTLNPANREIISL